MSDLRRKCFFCGHEIEGKKTLEHIIPNSLLGKLGIKEETVTGQREVQYSRVKVPAHSVCNSEFGSQYENRVLELLDDVDLLYEKMKSEESSMPMVYMPGESTTEIFTTWLSKVFYGLFYYDLITSKDEEWKKVCSSLLNGQNFEYVRSSYKYGQGFQLPSSLYVFKTINAETDLTTMVDPSSILMKIGPLTIILCICDGFLTKNYLNGEVLSKLRSYVADQDERDINFPSHKLAFAEILALRTCIPKTPKFVSGNNQIINMSLSTCVANPEEHYAIDSEQLKLARSEVLSVFNIKLSQSST